MPALDRFTGTGDVVGALIAALLGGGLKAIDAAVTAVSYFRRNVYVFLTDYLT